MSDPHTMIVSDDTYALTVPDFGTVTYLKGAEIHPGYRKHVPEADAERFKQAAAEAEKTSSRKASSKSSD